MPSYLILPGISNSGPQHWQTAWEADLPGAHRVSVKNWERPVCGEWVAALERDVAALGADVVLVAHSLGCLQVVHWARGTRLAVGGAFLVAPPDPDGPGFPKAAVGFSPLPLARLPFASTVVISRDDPYADVAFSRRCAEAWGARMIDAGPRGHLNAQSGLGDWPEGRRWLLELKPELANSSR